VELGHPLEVWARLRPRVSFRPFRAGGRYGPINTNEEEVVHVRVVRFTDVSAERMESLQSRINDSGGPPPGIPATGIKVLFDEDQGTAVVLQYFATADDMRTGAEGFSAMDPSDTPGTRVSVDMCELKLELDAP
jgi:hypothetical protein